MFDPLFPHRPWTVCFYGYRGGLGRTTLACNVAKMLASLPVFTKQTEQFGSVGLLDLDLEAPGMDWRIGMPQDRKTQKGLVEYIREYLAGGVAPDLLDYVYSVPGLGLDGYVETCPVLQVMSAGLYDDAFVKFVTQLDWSRFYGEQDGYLFFENMRAGLKKEFNLDYLFVDSRPGLNRHGGVCMSHLADAVVLLFEPSHEHLEGLRRVVQVLKKREKAEERRIPRLYAATRIPDNSSGDIGYDLAWTCYRCREYCEAEVVDQIRLTDSLDDSLRREYLKQSLRCPGPIDLSGEVDELTRSPKEATSEDGMFWAKAVFENPRNFILNEGFEDGIALERGPENVDGVDSMIVHWDDCASASYLEIHDEDVYRDVGDEIELRLKRRFVAECGAVAWWIRKTDLRVQEATGARPGDQEGDASREAE